MSPCLNDNFCSWSIPKNRNLTDPEFHRPQRSQRLKEYYNHLTYYPCFHRLLDRFYLFKSMVGFQWPSRHPILVPMNHRVPMPITTYTRICIVTTQFCNIGGGNEQGSDPLLIKPLIKNLPIECFHEYNTFYATGTDLDHFFTSLRRALRLL